MHNPTTVTPIKRAVDEAVPEALGEALEQLSCLHCEEPISRREMVAIWIAGDYIAHLACWAQHHDVVKNTEATT